MSAPAGGIRVAALYRFARFDDPDAIRGPLLALARACAIGGTLLLAREGINGTIAGGSDAVDAVLAHIRALPGCADLDVKDSRTDTPPFYRLKVRVKREIVTMGQPALDPLTDAGRYVAPADWNTLIADPHTLLIDTRNDYEAAVGSFAGAVNPGTRSFRDFPAWFRANRVALMAGKTRVAMFCTGGIRCEKATAFVRAEGLDDVHHLQGGILRYLETIAPGDSPWQGECFVFDQRVAVGHALAPGTHGLCHACRMPVGEEGRASPLYESGISCAGCHAQRDEIQRAGYAERHRQTLLAKARGERHVGAEPGGGRAGVSRLTPNRSHSSDS